MSRKIVLKYCFVRRGFVGFALKYKPPNGYITPYINQSRSVTNDTNGESQSIGIKKFLDFFQSCDLVLNTFKQYIHIYRL